MLPNAYKDITNASYGLTARALKSHKSQHLTSLLRKFFKVLYFVLKSVINIPELEEKGIAD